ncbi:MAG: hypothetical protein Q4G39_00375 [Brachymonas sp.]|nr:hypothetical protein [Brachymonas sp.]
MRDHYLARDLFGLLGKGIDLAVVLMAVGWLLAAWFAWRKPKQTGHKLLWLTVVAGGALMNVALVQYAVNSALQPLREQKTAYQLRYDAAKAVFDERCKTAGVKIYKTVENVEGIQLEGLREGGKTPGMDNPDWEGAGMPYEYTGKSFIKSFLFNEYQGTAGFNDELQPYDPAKGLRGSFGGGGPLVGYGYRYVDVKQEDGSFIRYHRSFDADGKPMQELAQEPIPAANAARYMVRYINDPNPEDRKHWVAGATVAITDSHTDETLAELRAFAFEQLFGSTNQRLPWRNVRQMCPLEAYHGDNKSIRFFVDQIIKPIQEPKK